ncbi:MAG: nucleotidyltransferase domain-containing protein [Actinomycetota bacterium]
MTDPLSERRQQRDRLLSEARSFASRLNERIEIKVAIVAGSVARGDFNVWSDIDLLVVSDDLESRAPDRMLQLNQDAPPGLEVIGLTPDEYRVARRKRNRLVLEAERIGLVVLGEPNFGDGGR